MNLQRLLSIGLMLGMLVAYWFLLARGELAEIQTIQREIRSLRSSMLASEVVAARLDEVQVQVDEVSTWLQRMQDSYESEDSASDFLLDVANTLDECGLAASETAPGLVEEFPPFNTQGIRVVVEGELDGVFEFLHRMESGRPLCRVTDLRVVPGASPGEIRADLTVLRLWKGA